MRPSYWISPSTVRPDVSGGLLALGVVRIKAPTSNTTAQRPEVGALATALLVRAVVG